MKTNFLDGDVAVVIDLVTRQVVKFETPKILFLILFTSKFILNNNYHNPIIS